jgi:O-antigen/teichoic acid export membrane protein
MTSNAGLPLTAVVLPVFFGTDMSVLLVGALLSRCVGLAIALFALWRDNLRGQRVEFDRGYSKKLLTFGFWIMMVAFTAPVLVTIDRMMIGAQLGAIALAAYTIPYQVISRLQLIPQSVTNVILPRMSVAKGNDARELALNYTVIVAGLFAPIVVGLIFLIEPLLSLWLGDNLDNRSAPVGMYLLCAFLLTVIAQSASVFLQSQNAGRFVASFQLAEIVPYSLLLFAAAEAYGLLGVGLAFLLRRAVEAAVFVARSRFGSWRFWSSQVPAVVGIVVSLALHNQFEPLLAKLAMGSLIALAVLVAAALCAPPGTKALIAKQVRMRLRPG